MSRTQEFVGTIDDPSLQMAFERAALTGNAAHVELIFNYYADRQQSMLESDEGWLSAIGQAALYARCQGHTQALEFISKIAGNRDLDVQSHQYNKENEAKAKEKEHEYPSAQSGAAEHEYPSAQSGAEEKERERPKAKEEEAEYTVPAIIQAGLNHNLAEVVRLVQEGADINTLARAGGSPLLVGGNVAWAFVDVHVPDENEDVVDQALEWLEQHGADLTQLNAEGYSLNAPVSRRRPNRLRWMFEHGVRLSSQSTHLSPATLQRRMEQVKAAYPELFLQNLVLAAVYPKQKIIEGIVKELSEKKTLAPAESELVNRAFVLAVAQDNNAYSVLLKKFAQYMMPQSLQQALLVAAARGNYLAVMDITESAAEAMRAALDDWQVIWAQALERAIAHNRSTVMSYLLRVMPASVSRGVIGAIKDAIRGSALPGLERTSIIRQMEKILQSAPSEVAYLPRDVTSAFSNIMLSLPSGAIDAVIALFFSV